MLLLLLADIVPPGNLSKKCMEQAIIHETWNGSSPFPGLDAKISAEVCQKMQVREIVLQQDFGKGVVYAANGQPQ